METIGKLFVGIILAVIGVIIGGWVFMTFWGWFMLPAFPTLPHLTLEQSIGVATFLSILTHKRDKESKDKDFGDIVANWFESIIYIFVMFGFGWVVYLFIQ
jgi:hypothetical protein